MDAEYSARLLGRVDPLSVKHEVEDERAVERTHPSYYSLAEQWEHYVQAIQALRPGEAYLRLPDDRVVKVQTPQIARVQPPPDTLEDVERYYLTRLFRPRAHPASRTVPRQDDLVPKDGPAPITRRSD